MYISRCLAIMILTAISYSETASQTVYPDPAVSVRVSPERSRLCETVRITWNCSVPGKKLSDIIETRYKLDVPGDWTGGISYALKKWSDWKNEENGNVTYGNFVVEGKYGVSVQCRNRSTGKQSQISSRNFQVYWEYPEIRDAAFNINWAKANQAKTPKERSRILADEFKEAYSMWDQKYEYQFRLLRATSSPQEVLDKLVGGTFNSVNQEAFLQALEKGNRRFLQKFLTPLDVYEIIKQGVTDLILIYRNAQANEAASMTVASYYAWKFYEKRGR